VLVDVEGQRMLAGDRRVAHRARSRRRPARRRSTDARRS
jgi:hypothetical protein